MSNAPQSQATTAIQRVKSFIEARAPELSKVAPRVGGFSIERVQRIVLSNVARDKNLLACEPQSIYTAVHQAVQLGLEPGGPLGHAYLVPYKDKCQLIVGYKGLIALARRSGEIRSIESHVVREGDTFDVEFGLTPKLVHKPNMNAETPGKPKFVYAVAHLADGGVQSEMMTIAEVNAIKNRSRASQNGPWVTDYDEMARKTVIRRLSKYLPMTVELAEAVERIDIADDDAPEVDVTPADTSAGSVAMASLPPSDPTDEFALLVEKFTDARDADDLVAAREQVDFAAERLSPDQKKALAAAEKDAAKRVGGGK